MSARNFLCDDVTFLKFPLLFALRITLLLVSFTITISIKRSNLNSFSSVSVTKRVTTGLLLTADNVYLTIRRFNAIVSQLKMHYFSEGAFESLIALQLLKKEKYIWSY